MFRRILTGVAGVAALFAMSAPADAAFHVISQTTSAKHASGLTVRQGLTPGHVYQLHVTSPQHVKITALGTEEIVYVVKGRMGTLNQAVKFKGKTPYTYVLKQPGNVSAGQWIFGLQVTTSSRQSLTLKVIDLGKKR